MFFNLHTSKWSLKMIAENFKDWIYQSCVERDEEKREKEALAEDSKAEENNK